MSIEKMKVVAQGVEDGIEWRTCEAPMYGAVNGYVLVPEGHPWHGLGYDRIYGVEVNGGLTYSDGEWIGFDTLHGGDNWPGMDRSSTWPAAREWTPELVAEEAKSLARQVANAPEPVTFSPEIEAHRTAAYAEWSEFKGYADSDDFNAAIRMDVRDA